MNNQKTIVSLVYLFVLFLTLGIACMLFFQYRYFKQEAQELSQVKEAYYQHVEMLKRSLNASMAQDQDTEEESSDTQAEKKKIITDKSDQNIFISVEDDDSEDTESESLPEFQVISKEEDARLKSFKSSLKKIHTTSSKKHKRVSKNALSRSLKKSTRYTPQRDFVFSWPIDISNFWLSSLFGPRKRPGGRVEFHHGIDMAAVRGNHVMAAADGKVILAQPVAGFGNCIIIEHNNRYKTRYAHLYKIKVRQGQYVKTGDYIGIVGATGNVRGKGDPSHLHFEVYRDGIRVNPLIYLFT